MLAREIARRRMLAQRLWGRPGSRPEAVVRGLVAMQAQDPAPARWSVGQRPRGELLVDHVAAAERDPDPEWAGRIQALVRDLGGEFQVVEAEDPVEGALAFAYRQHVTQIVVGESLRSRWQEFLLGSFVNRLIQKASSIDVHVIARRGR